MLKTQKELWAELEKTGVISATFKVKIYSLADHVRNEAFSKGVKEGIRQEKQRKKRKVTK